ncbi:MAG TPA: hypothetical protein V6D47_20815 [Oscillatoriaceae cyanobacterium]
MSSGSDPIVASGSQAARGIVAPMPSVAALVEWARRNVPKRAYKFELAVKRVLPYVAPGGTDGSDLVHLAEAIPAERLFVCLDKKKKGAWAPDLVETHPEFATQQTLAKEYRKAFVAVLDQAVKKRFLHAAALGVAQAWQDARQALDDSGLPYNVTRLQALLDAGQTSFFGTSLVDKAPQTIATMFRTVLDGFNVMGRFMSERGIGSPEEVLQEHLYGPPDAFYSHQRGINATAMTTAYYRVRVAWNILGQLPPFPKLVPWPEPSLENQIALEDEECHPRILELIDQIDKALSEMAEDTRIGISRHLKRFFGWLAKVRGMDLEALCATIACAEDLAWLFLAGHPAPDRGREPSRETELAKIFADERYRETLLQGIMRSNRCHEAQMPCRRNPVLSLYVEWYATERNSPSSAEVFTKYMKIVARRFLRIHKSQLDWFSELYDYVMKKKTAKPASAKAQRKEAAGDDHELWLKLVAARPRLKIHLDKLKQKWKASEDPEDAIHWAIAQRNDLMVGLLLGLQLRSKNIHKMQFRIDLFPKVYKVSIPPNKAKAGKRILRNFPAAGPLADLRSDLDIYLSEARPILLAGRQDSPYVFIGHPQRQSSRDDDGHIKIGKGMLAKVLQDVSNEFFADLLPEGLDLLSPHLTRDVLTNYARRLENGNLIASQSLANTLQVMDNHYYTASRSRDDDALEFLENLDTHVKPGGRADLAKSRKQFGDLVVKKFPEWATKANVNALLQIFDRCR